MIEGNAHVQFWNEIRRLVALTGALSTLVACSGASESPLNSRTDDSVSSQVEYVTGEGILVCAEDALTGRVDAWYSLAAMNAKLRHYPDLAAFAGVDSVEHCESARRVYRAAWEYNALHPGFDADEPIDVPELPEPARPPAEPDHEVLSPPASTGVVAQPLKNGTPSNNAPVVYIASSAGECTGTFIGRNWLLTAAHCLAIGKDKNGPWDPNTSTPDKFVAQWHEFYVGFAGPNGEIVRQAHFKHVRQYFDPRFLGFEREEKDGWQYLPDPAYAKPTGTAWDHDIGLLFFLDTQDNELPTIAKNPPDGTGLLMGLDLRNSISGGVPTIWGFSSNDGTQSPADSTLRTATTVSYTIETIGDNYEATNPTSASAPVVCKGDSGGPLVQRSDAYLPREANPKNVQLVSGVLSRVSLGPDNCGTSPGVTIWSRVRPTIERIELWISNWYPGFKCQRGSTVGGGGPDAAFCWGASCTSDSDCFTSEYCSRPGPTLKNCQGRCAGGGCDCMPGQCLPKAED